MRFAIAVAPLLWIRLYRPLSDVMKPPFATVPQLTLSIASSRAVYPRAPRYFTLSSLDLLALFSGVSCEYFTAAVKLSFGAIRRRSPVLLSCSKNPLAFRTRFLDGEIIRMYNHACHLGLFLFCSGEQRKICYLFDAIKADWD